MNLPCFLGETALPPSAQPFFPRAVLYTAPQLTRCFFYFSAFFKSFVPSWLWMKIWRNKNSNLELTARCQHDRPTCVIERRTYTYHSFVFIHSHDCQFFFFSPPNAWSAAKRKKKKTIMTACSWNNRFIIFTCNNFVSVVKRFCTSFTGRNDSFAREFRKT